MGFCHNLQSVWVQVADSSKICLSGGLNGPEVSRVQLPFFLLTIFLAFVKVPLKYSSHLCSLIDAI